ncbi:coiled-coil domain-containing protein 172 isoform X3 [Corapipo altera]|uniref:coiled-coil domain-containing protein 172 isoform X3 n=1 Tax=Corapipo altera TaxID=415028 RepID=UPI000FD676D0|nr:coiled-coil domain-containing protein 172 isoform X3 [Corapipo altera]
MNLDALFQQIQFTEKQAREKRHFIQQAKCDINRSYEKINQIKEELSAAKVNLETKTDAKRKIAEEEDNFTREVTEFNNEYGLTSNRDLLIKKKVKTEIKDLENEAALLKNEMESMEHKNVQLNALQLQKNELKQDLFTLQSELKDLEEVIREAGRVTKDLEAEKVQVTEKPQTDPECLRLKKELEKCKDDSWENVCETLQTEIEILQMNLSQKKSSGGE